MARGGRHGTRGLSTMPGHNVTTCSDNERTNGKSKVRIQRPNVRVKRILGSRPECNDRGGVVSGCRERFRNFRLKGSEEVNYEKAHEALQLKVINSMSYSESARTLTAQTVESGLLYGGLSFLYHGVGLVSKQFSDAQKVSIRFYDTDINSNPQVPEDSAPGNPGETDCSDCIVGASVLDLQSSFEVSLKHVGVEEADCPASAPHNLTGLCGLFNLLEPIEQPQRTCKSQELKTQQKKSF